MATIEGRCDIAFEALRKAFSDNLASGEEVGASICVNIHGKTVVDIWGGFSDAARTKPWKEDTMPCVMSSAKTVTNLAALILIDRGLLDAYAKVADYWPEFAVNGKADIEVRHILSHTSGISGWDAPVTMEDIYDTPTATSRLAQQAPWWEDRSTSGYHAITQGFLVGELVRRGTGKSLKRFIAEDMAGPLNADYQLGLLEKDWPRMPELIFPAGKPFEDFVGDETVVGKTARGTPLSGLLAQDEGYRLSELGGSNGYGTARGLATILSMVSCGGKSNGIRFLSPKTIDLIFEEQSDCVDLVLNRRTRFGIGFGLPVTDVVDWIPDGRVCFWSGWGGSIQIMDVDRGLTISYCMNRLYNGLVGSKLTEQYVRKIYEAVMSQG